MIDVGNDSVVAVWKSYVCFPPPTPSALKQNWTTTKYENKTADSAVDETLTQ